MQPSAHQEEEEEEGPAQHTAAKAMVGIYFASKDYMEAYRGFRDAHTAEGPDERKLVDELMSRLRELVGRCQLYLREHPQEEERIELVIDGLLVMKHDEEAARVVSSCAHHLLCKVEREGERFGFLNSFDDEPGTATYGQRIDDCPSCGERLGLLGLFAAGPCEQQNG